MFINKYVKHFKSIKLKPGNPPKPQNVTFRIEPPRELKEYLKQTVEIQIKPTYIYFMQFLHGLIFIMMTSKITKEWEQMTLARLGKSRDDQD